MESLQINIKKNLFISDIWEDYCKQALFAQVLDLDKVYIKRHNILCFVLTFILGDVIMANVGRFFECSESTPVIWWEMSLHIIIQKVGVI